MLDFITNSRLFGFFGKRSFDGSDRELESIMGVEDKAIEENDEAKSVNVNATLMHKNSEYLMSIVRAYQRGVVGSSIGIQSKSSNHDFNRDFEGIIKQWSKKGNCEITGRYYRGLAERSVVSEILLRGGCILRHHFNDKWKFGYKFEVLPLYMIDTGQSNHAEGLFNGIKTNSNGYVTKIYLFNDNTLTDSSPVSFKKLELIVPPLFDALQYSGVSQFAPLISSVDLLVNFSKAELESAKNRASMSIVVKTHMFAEIMKARKKQNGNLTLVDVATIYEKFKIKREGKGVNYIPIDDDVKSLQTPADNTYNAINAETKKIMASALGLGTIDAFREQPSSYTASLLESKLNEQSYQIFFTDVVELGWREVIERKLMDSLVLKGLLKQPADYWTDRDRYLNIKFLRASVEHVDPSKVAKSITENLKNRVTTHTEEITKKGKDVEEVIIEEVQYQILYEQIENEMREKANLPKIKKDEDNE